MQVFGTPTITADDGVTIDPPELIIDNGQQKYKLTIYVPSTYTYDEINFHVTYNFSTLVNISNPFNKSIIFPLDPNSIPADAKNYLSPDVMVTSGDAGIISTAKTITSGKTDLIDVVDALTQWIECNINFDNLYKDRAANDVLKSKKTQCEGSANLLAAFCRSLGIPARICAGQFIGKLITIPLTSDFTPPNVSWSQGSGSIPDPHSACEIYFPIIGEWVRCDPAQRTVYFGWPHFIKCGHAVNAYTINVANGPTQAIIIDQSQFHYDNVSDFKRYYSSTIGNTSINLSATDFNAFNLGNKSYDQNNLLFTIFRNAISTPITDEIKIENPPVSTQNCESQQLPSNSYIFAPGDIIHYSALFTSANCITRVTGIHWLVNLYHSGGIYTLIDSSINHPRNCWSDGGCGTGYYNEFATPAVLPHLNWLYDLSGNIYGTVNVTVQIDDGTGKSDRAIIGVTCLKDIQNVTYNTNTTVNSCSAITLTNISVTNNANVNINSNGGVTINGTFQAQKGTTLSIKK